MVTDVQRDAKVALEFQGHDENFLFVQVQGKARILTSKRAMAEHWQPELERWFKDGLDTEGLVMLRVDATRIAYWSVDGDGVIEP